MVRPEAACSMSADVTYKAPSAVPEQASRARNKTASASLSQETDAVILLAYG
jgi:hypothetical protein